MTTRIPLWPGAVMDFGTSRWQVQAVTPNANYIEPGGLWVRAARRHIDGESRLFGVDPDGLWHMVQGERAAQVGSPFRPTLDLTDDDTFEGARRRLAERLGAPPDAVAQGCRFWLETFRRFVGGDLDDYDDTTLEDFTAWLLKAGDLKLCRGGGWAVDKPGNEYNRGLLAEGITDPAEALAAVWAQVLVEVKPCP